MEEKCCCRSCSEKSKVRTEKDYKSLVSRLNRIEGQVRGIKKMLDEDRYCIDIINQVAAVNAALCSFNKLLLSEHIKTCVKEDILKGSDEMTDELCETLQRLMR